MNTPISYEKNSFDIIRWYAAVAVMLLHYTGYFFIFSSQNSTALSTIRNIVVFFPGVIVLFSLSGFLVASSYERSGNRKLFFQKRVFRLFPELWICTIFNFLLLSVLTFRSFDKSIVIWLFTQIPGIANTPSCLKDFATGSVNGALWTIFVELQLYILTMFFYPILKKISIVLWGILLFLFAGLNLILGYLAPMTPSLFQKIIERSFLPYAFWFLAGMFCYIQRTRLLPLLKKACPFLAIAYFILYRCITEQPGYYCGIITSIFCPFITIGLAYLLPAFRLKIDLSYGLFLYHWIILNVLIHFNLISSLPWPVTLLLFISATLFIAYGSQTLAKHLLQKFNRASSKQND